MIFARIGTGACVLAAQWLMSQRHRLPSKPAVSTRVLFCAYAMADTVLLPWPSSGHMAPVW